MNFFLTLKNICFLYPFTDIIFIFVLLRLCLDYRKSFLDRSVFLLIISQKLIRMEFSSLIPIWSIRSKVLLLLGELIVYFKRNGGIFFLNVVVSLIRGSVNSSFFKY